MALVSTVRIVIFQNPRVTNLGWLIAVWTVPILGSLSFLCLRIALFSTCKKCVVVNNTTSDSQENKPPDNTLNESQLNNLLNVGLYYNLGDYSRYESAELQSDDSFIDSLTQAIGRAEKQIFIVQYIFTGKTAKRMVDLLKEAHNRGVEVFLLVDALGSGMLFPWSKTARNFRSLPFKVAIFSPLYIFLLPFVNVRNHAKIAYIDGKKIWIGSHNIRDEVYVSNPIAKKPAKNHTVCLSGGENIQQVAFVCEHFWHHATGKVLKLHVPKEDKSLLINSDLSRVIFRDSNTYWATCLDIVVTAINEAKEKILIINPYFIPPRIVLQALLLAAKRRVKIELILPESSDIYSLNYVMPLNFQQILNVGGKVYLSPGIFDHTKIMMIDEAWIFLGSLNFDYRSMMINYEANLEIISKKFADKIKELAEETKQKAKSLDNYNVTTLRRTIGNIFSLFSSIY